MILIAQTCALGIFALCRTAGVRSGHRDVIGMLAHHRIENRSLQHVDFWLVVIWALLATLAPRLGAGEMSLAALRRLRSPRLPWAG